MACLETVPDAFYPAEPPLAQQSAERRRYLLRQRLTALPGGSERALERASDTGDEAVTPSGERSERGGGALPRSLRGPTPLHIVRRWERDERVAAWEQAQEAAARDPDAAALLLDCLSADPSSAGYDSPDDGSDEGNDGGGWDDDARDTYSPPASPSVTPAAGKPFDPMRLLARVARYYRWSHQDIRRMPWRTFLGYAREADIMRQEEQIALDAEIAHGRAGGGGSHGAGGSRDRANASGWG